MPFDGSNYDSPVTNPVVTNGNPVTELLEQAWSLIDKPQKWTRNQPQSLDGRRYCSMAALYAVAGNGARFTDDVGSTDYAKAVGFLHVAMGRHVPAFNDNHRHAEVAAAWQRAIAASRSLP